MPCPVCRTDRTSHRPAIYCAPACRWEACRRRRLAAGLPEAGHVTLARYVQRRRDRVVA